MTRITRVLLFALLVSLGCGSRAAVTDGDASSPATGVVRGTVFAWPRALVQLVGDPCAGRPAADVELTWSSGGKPVKTVRSAADGTYQAAAVGAPASRPRRRRDGADGPGHRWSETVGARQRGTVSTSICPHASCGIRSAR